MSDEIRLTPEDRAAIAVAKPVSRQHVVSNGKVAPSRLDVVRLSDVQPEKVEWLWAARIPENKLTMLVGDPGTGKSFASTAIAASVRGSRAV